MSSDFRVLRNAVTGVVVLPRAKMCTSYWCHLRGLQFRLQLPSDEGLLFVTNSESVVNTAIHMLNMFFSIGVVWLDSSGTVVDKKLAKPWRLAYAPAKPARYYLEANPDVLERVEIGDVLQFDEAAR